MSSDSSDSEGGTRRGQSFPVTGDESKGPRTPGSPLSVHSPPGSPPRVHSPPGSPPSVHSPPGSPPSVHSPPGSQPSVHSPSGSPSGMRSKSQSRSPSAVRSRSGSVSRSGARSVSRSPPRRPRSPPENFDDDGRSNISSSSSILSHTDVKVKPEASSPSSSPAKSAAKPTSFSVPNADDLSDVSDIDDSDGLADDTKSTRSSKSEQAPPVPPRDKQQRVSHNIDMDDGEQLDFEAEDQPEVEKEDGELDATQEPNLQPKKTRGEKPEKEKEREEGEDKSADEGELKEEEGEGAESLEEGEVTDEGDPKPEKPPICRFFSRGACTWGANCRFLHPGVTDKGNYSMFDVTRPMVAPPNGLSHYAADPRPYPLMVPPSRGGEGYHSLPAVRRELPLSLSLPDPAGVESAWERGLRQAKELMRKSSKRKETDMDFEEKKMNLSIGQEEMDKENDYYTRVAVASPVDDAYTSRLSPKVEGERRGAVRVVERYEDIITDPPLHHSPPVYDRYDYRRTRDPEYMLRREKKYYTEDEMLARKTSKKMVREVIVQRVERERGKRPPEDPLGGRRPDEWLDPWMRSKSPGGRKAAGGRQRKVSYSSASASSSYSGSSSRSSSNSSYSSYSRSRSRSRSGSRSGSGSPSPARARRGRRGRRGGGSPPTALPARAKLGDGKFKPLKGVEKAVTPMLMNPPAPSPRRLPPPAPLSPSAAIRKVGLNPPAPTASQKRSGKTRGRKSRSSSSGSSGSTSESSHSSFSSSSSSSRGASSPPARGAKKSETEERGERGGGGKRKRGDPLNTQSANISESKAVTTGGKKRPAEDPPAADPSDASPTKPGGVGLGAASKKAPASRREELLKQLKAVEDAIARKRSKI